MSELIDKFSNKPVNAALTQNRPQTSGGSPESQPQNTEPTKPERRRGFRPIHGIAIGTAALLAAGSAIVYGVSQSQGEKPNEATATSAPLDPSEAPAEPAPVEGEAPVDGEPLPNTETIAVDAALIEHPEDLAGTFVDRTSDWFMAGATPEHAEAAWNSAEGPEAYALNLAAELDQKYIEELLVDDWQSKPQLKEWVEERMIPTHANTLKLYILTSLPDINPEDTAPYVRESTFDGLVAVQPLENGLAVTNYEHDSDNADLNRVGEALTNGTQVAGEMGQPTRSYVVVDGKVKLSDITFG